MGLGFLLSVFLVVVSFAGCHAEYLCDTGELRLVNGSGNNNGRLEFCRSGVWGTVSDYDFDMNDAQVACRKLGFNPNGNGLLYRGGAYYGEGTGQVFMGYLHCQGSEDQLLDCDYDNSWIGNDHSHDVGLTCPRSSCTQGSLRLTGGYVSTEGTLEVCNNGAWNSICGDEFQRQDGYVACRQLGYPATATQVVTSYRFNNGHGSPTWTKFGCYGNESTLSSCQYDNSVCEGYNPTTANFAIVGLKCEGQVISSCQNGDTRLNGSVGPGNSIRGRIEICSNNAWGTVTSNSFGLKDALVACRQLGFPSPGVRVYPPAYFGDSGSGPILMNNLACLGSEQNLYQCNQGFTTSYAESHSNDATIGCWTKQGDTCTTDVIRFRNGSNLNNYGRVEVCRFQEWGSICDDGWDRNDARTVCNQQNFSPSYASFYTNSTFGDGDQIPVLFTNIDCESSDATFSDCSKNDQIETNCNFGHTAGVRCFRSDGCTDGEVRLMGGNSDREGEVQICRGGKWGYICSDNWNNNAAQVVCRQLGFSERWSSYSRYNLFGGSQDLAPLVYDGANCAGTESSLSGCTLTDYGAANPVCTSIAGVMCAESGVSCNNWDVRLADGSVSGDGRVEICNNNVWTTVDTSNWNYNNAKVVCRAQGYNDTWAVALSQSQLGSGNRRIVYHSFQCNGNEGNLQACSKSSYLSTDGMDSWYSSLRAGVSCRRRSDAETCTTQGAVRLKDGSSAREGRLEVCVNGYWGSVCSTGWTRDNSLVACRSAGYETLRPIMTQGAYSGQGQGPVNLANVYCLGHETSLFSECSSTSAISVSNCYHGNDVGLRCSEMPADYYNLTVTTSPDPVDISIGTRVTLTCSSSPAPPSGVTYEWRSTITEDPIVQSDTSSPTAFVTISSKHPKISHYYCAMKWNYEVLAIGSIKLTVKNLLVPAQSTYQVARGGSVTLTVVPSLTWGTSVLRNLRWYFHGAPLQVYYDGNYSISSDGYSLTLRSVSEIYSGQYSLQYDGLSLYQNSPTCEGNLLELLREYPLFAPAVITLQVGSINLADTSLYITSDSLLIPNSIFTPYKKGTNFLSLVTHSLLPTVSTFFSFRWHEFSMASFSSGQISGLHVASGLLSPNTNPHYALDFIVPTVLQSGYYEAQLTVQIDAMLNSIGCGKIDGYSYADFLNTLLGFTSDVVLGSAKQAIAYYETPSAQLTASTTVFTNDSNSTVVCSSQGGYPLYYNLSVVKNGWPVANSLGSPWLVYNTLNDDTGRKYGNYWCVVNNLFDTDSTAVLLRERASMNLSLSVSSCGSWTDANKGEFMNPIMNLLQDVCNCTFSSGAFTIDALVCTTNIEEETSEVRVTSSLVYSNDNGDQTSSTIFQSLFDTFDMGNSLSLTVANQTLSVKWPRNEPDSSIKLPHEALLALLFLAGFVASTSIFVLAIVVICFVKRRKARAEATKSAPPVAFHSKPDEVVVSETQNEEEEEWELPADNS